MCGCRPRLSQALEGEVKANTAARQQAPEDQRRVLTGQLTQLVHQRDKAREWARDAAAALKKSLGDIGG